MTTLRTDGLYCAYLRKSRKDVELENQGCIKQSNMKRRSLHGLPQV